MTATVLFVDDDPLVREVVRATLERTDLQVLMATDGEKGLEVWRQTPIDLVILDVMMPGMDGLATCRYIRQVSEVPVMMLTARGSEQDILRGFEAGADDYLIKPFRPKELIDRIRAILDRLRSQAPEPSGRLAYGGITLDPESRQVVRDGAPVSLSSLEFTLLSFLLKRHGEVIEPEEVFENVWGYAMPAGGAKLLESAVNRLREAIEPDPSQPRFIESVYGAGIRFGVQS